LFPWRIVPNMLIVAARQLRNPVSFIVEVIAGDRLRLNWLRFHESSRGTFLCREQRADPD
jgi:hypothetical protein